MSTAMALAGVTAVLQNLLNTGFVNNDVSGIVGGTVEVSAVAPDRVIVNGNLDQARINIFLHRVTGNAGWNNAYMPSRDGRGQRLTNQPLALNLHYLLTSYGLDDLQAEVLLGFALQVLHEIPVLAPDAIRDALSPAGGGNLPQPMQDALANSGLADQVEQIKFVPEYLNSEEMSKLWTAFQSNYRPSAAYQASVALIQAERPTRTPLPVLTRGHINPETNREIGIIAQPHLIPPVPTITAVEPQNQQTAVRLGEPLILNGHHLDGENIRVQFSTRRLEVPIEVSPLAGSTATRMTVQIPDQPQDWVAGIYQALVLVEQPVPMQPGETEQKTSNGMPLILAPNFSGVTVHRNPDNEVTVSLTPSPEVRPGQTVSLILGQNESLAEPFESPAANLTFRFAALEAGDYWTRLRVDGVDSLLIDPSTEPPTFIQSQSITVPA